MRVNNSGPTRHNQTKRLLHTRQPDTSTLETLCGVHNGKPLVIDNGRHALVTPANHIWHFAKAGETVTCGRCLKFTQ